MKAMKYISAPSQWAIYQVPDETFAMFGPQFIQLPPVAVLELMCMNGKAKRVGVAGGFEIGVDDTEENEEATNQAMMEELTGESHDETEEPEAPPDGLWYTGGNK